MQCAPKISLSLKMNVIITYLTVNNILYIGQVDTFILNKDQCEQ